MTTFTEAVSADYRQAAIAAVERNLARGYSMHDAIGAAGIHRARVYAEHRGVRVAKSWPLYRIAEKIEGA